MDLGQLDGVTVAYDGSMSADAKDVEAMSIKELKALITSAGLSTKDCVEKADLRRRAAQARLAAGGGSTSPPGAAAPAAPSGPSPLGSCDTPSTLGGTAQQDAFAWLVELLGPLEGRARELRGGNRGKLDVMVLDLRVRRGADPTPDARILADAHMFSRARPKSIVSHMDSLGFPKSFARPQVAIILSKCSFREEDTTVICCVGDKVPPRGGRPPPNFNHTFFSTCFDKLQGIRDRAAARLEEKMMSKGELDTPDEEHGLGPGDARRLRVVVEADAALDGPLPGVREGVDRRVEVEHAPGPGLVG